MQHNFKDLTGQTFGKLTALRYVGNSIWECQCSCGNIKNIHRYSLLRGASTSCGCASTIDKTGKKCAVQLGDKFGDWEVIDNTVVNNKVKCKCSCGKEKEVNIYTLKSGKSTGCGHNKNKDRVIDLTGRTFGDLTVLEYVGEQKWKCKCSCGNIVVKYRNNLLDGRATTCGFHTNARIPEDLTGQRFGKLVALKYFGHKSWICKCDCGNTKVILSTNLKNGSTKSCGCIQYTPTREELINLIDKYTDEHGRKPGIIDLAELAGVSYKSITYHLNRTGIEQSLYLDTRFSSRAEREIYEFVASIVGTNEVVIHNTFKVISPFELDIYIPSRKLAIEFNGNYWHSSKTKSEEYHQRKTILCIKNGIRLIHIFEYEWLNDKLKNKLKMFISDILNTKPTIIYGRDTKIVEISNSESKEFCNKYHLQCGIDSEFSLGLEMNGEILGVITIGKPRFNKSFEYEIYRVCFKHDIRVLGGVSKLFKGVIKAKNINSIVSYANLAKFTGESYLKIGMKTSAENVTKPNYVWVNQYNNVLNRYETTKSRLVEYGLGDRLDTEKTIMESLGYMQVFDSGNLRFEWHKEAGGNANVH